MALRDGAVVAGDTSSASFATTPGAFDRSYGGNRDAFITSLRFVPLGTQRYGAGSAGCRGKPVIHALDDASGRSASFGLACSRAPVDANGVLLLTAARLPAGLPVPGLGIELWVDVGTHTATTPVTANAAGEHVVTLPLAAAWKGAHFAAQYVWADPSCAGSPLSASDALEVTVQ